MPVLGIGVRDAGRFLVVGIVGGQAAMTPATDVVDRLKGPRGRPARSFQWTM
jgi:hypothetical protein